MKTKAYYRDQRDEWRDIAAGLYAMLLERICIDEGIYPEDASAFSLRAAKILGSSESEVIEGEVMVGGHSLQSLVELIVAEYSKNADQFQDIVSGLDIGD